MERRVLALENRVTAVEQAVLANTVLTRAIKDDTAELVVLLRGGKLFGKLLSWFVGIAAGFGGIYALWWKK